MRAAFRDITLEDVKNAIVTGTSLPNLEEPGLFQFRYSPFTYGNYLDNRPSLMAETVEDYGDGTKAKKTLYATIASQVMLLFVVIQNEDDANPSILQNMIDSVHIMQ